jgi:hypothetical protein
MNDEEHMRKGDEFFKKGDGYFRQAAEEYQKAIDLNRNLDGVRQKRYQAIKKWLDDPTC